MDGHPDHRGCQFHWFEPYKKVIEDYNNGIKEGEFNDQLRFKTKLIPYKGNDSWVEPTLMELKACLMEKEPPNASESCTYCRYVKKTLLV